VRRTVRYRLVVSVGAAVILALAGCGADASSSADGRAAPTGAIPTTSTSNGTTSEETKAALARVRAELSRQTTSRFTFSTVGKVDSLQGSGEVRRGTDPAARMTLSPEGDTSTFVTFVLIDRTAYVTRSDVEATVKPWATIDGSGSPELSRALSGQISGFLASTDFGQNLDLASVSTITVVGKKEVEGVPTTEYAVSTDVAKAIAATDGVVQQAMKALEASGVDAIEATWWIGDNDLPVRYTQQTNTGTIKVTYVDWGADLAIEAPPADQIGDLSALFDE
jgi:hypothetical protein